MDQNQLIYKVKNLSQTVMVLIVRRQWWHFKYYERFSYTATFSTLTAGLSLEEYLWNLKLMYHWRNNSNHNWSKLFSRIFHWWRDHCMTREWSFFCIALLYQKWLCRKIPSLSYGFSICSVLKFCSAVLKKLFKKVKYDHVHCTLTKILGTADCKEQRWQKVDVI